MKKIKVAHITTIDMSLRYLLLNQLTVLQQAGYEVCGISAPGPDVSFLETSGIRHFAVPMTRQISPVQDVLSLYRLYRVLRREHFDIVHTHTPKAGLLGRLAARLANVPVVVHTLHGFYFYEGMNPFVRRIYFFAERIAAACSDAMLSQNEEDIQTLLNKRLCQPSKISYPIFARNRLQVRVKSEG